ncbi:Rrf2 family transcriptional regulator [Acidomonas methanolica]|uniref:Rrf2 family transcriptional regulator n=1 Tax=Acidomonas methanolica TaxID=437 RepID=UPI00211A7A0B|nr:Rrf2 family transcriptional regulator [Acidomonas methanolica]MCQ9156634.1 Rrf2 family transcriptional regulator [Acidomonas methanolica]
MKLTLQTDYALRALIYLGVRTERLCSIREIAGAYGISEAHMVKVVHKLGQGGFAETLRGRNGGLRLGRAADEIVIGDVVCYFEENMALLACMENGAAATVCKLMPACRLQNVLLQARRAMMAVLNDHTLADVITAFEINRLTKNENSQSFTLTGR